MANDRPDLLAELNRAQAELALDEPSYIDSLRSKYYSSSMSSRTFSSAERTWMENNDHLRVGYLDHYLPFSDTDEQGNAAGIVVEVFPNLFASMGIDDLDITYKDYRSYDEMLAAIDAGEVDVVFPAGGGLYYSEESGIYLSNPVVSSSMELAFVEGHADEAASHPAVNEANRMQYYYVSTYFPDAKITFYPSIEARLDAVLTGDTGGTVLNGLRANDILRNSRYRELSLRQLTYGDDRCFGVKIGNEGLLKLLNRGINVLGSDYAANLAYRYTEGLYTYTIADFVANNAALLTLIVLVIAAVIIFLVVRESRRTKRNLAIQEAAKRDLEAANAELAESKEALSDALAQAEYANNAKTVFLNSMSHDMRTPMNAIVGFTELAAAHTDDPALVEEYLGNISVSSHHLLSLINDVLDMSRIESGQMTIEEAPVHLPDLIEDICTIVQAGADAKQQQLRIDTAGIVSTDIVTDGLRLSQVLLNILTNAVKFTPEGGLVEFMVRERQSDDAMFSEFEFCVRDSGIGMSEEFQKHLFEAFTREHTTVSGMQGSGLGMAITKRIVDMMGGTVSVSSTEGVGTEFTVCLRCKVGGGSAQAASLQDAAPDFSGKRVLLVEDNEMNRQIATVILQEAGFEVEIAQDGTEAVAAMGAAPADRFDIILMDIQMSQMDGYEATRRIRALGDPDKAGIPIIAMTANAFEDDRRDALEAGMDGHLAKPYDIPKMMHTIAEALEKGRAKRDSRLDVYRVRTTFAMKKPS